MAGTIFSKYTYSQLNGLFREQIWTKLDQSSKVEACQELENRLAAERGFPARDVIPVDMDGGCYGEQRGNYIYVNENLLRNNCFVTRDEKTGEIIGQYPVEAPGWQLYDTIVHEDEHGAQLDRGDAQTCRSYFTPETDSALYRIQHDEALAFGVGNYRTLNAIEEQRNLLGHLEPDMVQYINSVKNNRYEDALAEAQLRYGDEDIRRTLDQFTEDKENLKTRDNPSDSYIALQNKMQEQELREYSALNNGTEESGEGNTGQVGNNLRQGVEPDTDEQRAYSLHLYSESNHTVLANGLSSFRYDEISRASHSEQYPEEDGSEIFSIPENEKQGIFEDGSEIYGQSVSQRTAFEEDGSDIDPEYTQHEYGEDGSETFESFNQPEFVMEDGSESFNSEQVPAGSYAEDGSETLGHDSPSGGYSGAEAGISNDNSAGMDNG